MPDGLKERFACWKLRMFVRLFRPDICVKHMVAMDKRWVLGPDNSPTQYTCTQCNEEYRERKAAARRLHEAATEEILNGLKYCARKK